MIPKETQERLDAMAPHSVALLHVRGLPREEAIMLSQTDPDRIDFCGVVGGADAYNLVRAAQSFTYHCYNCGKQKPGREFDTSGTELCLPCYEEAGLENEHADGWHEEPVEGCPDCEAALHTA